MQNYTIFISFFNSYPITSGASAVSTNLFESWPNKRKKLFQLNHEKNKFKKNIYNFNIFSYKFYFKFLFLIPYTLFIYFKIRNKKVDQVVFEGASWTGYIYFVFFFLKIFLKKTKFIYHSHNVDFQFRQHNFFMYKISFFFEKKILKNFDISTAVSIEDCQDFKKHFNITSQILPNGVIFIKKFLKNVKKENYILFSGSLAFSENKKTFDNLLKNEFKILQKYFPKIKIYHTGGGKFRHYQNIKYIKELGTLTLNEYLQYLQKSLLVVVPSLKGPGTKVKVIEALGYEKILLTSKFGMRGIDNKYYKHIVYEDLKQFKDKIIKIKKYSNKNQIYKKIGKHYRNLYDMKILSKKFYDKNF